MRLRRTSRSKDYLSSLFLFTKMRNVGGIAQTEAMKSSDLFMKCRYLDELTGGRGTVFATGTPISNSMVELYTIQRYLQYNTLVQNNLQHFDAWASTFGETITAVELTPEGTGYRAKTRFARFYNLPELMAMFKEIADIKTADMLDLPVPTAVFHNISVKPSEIQKQMVAELAERAERVRNGMVDAKEDNNHIDAIIGLPANIFFGTGIPTIIMVLRQKRENTDVLIIDASKGFIKEGKNNKLRASDIKRIADTFIKRESIPKFSRVVSREEIRSNDYNLNIPRYVDSSEAAEHWDVYASMFGGIPTAEIDEMSEFWTAFPALKKALFTESGIPYVNVSTPDIKSAIKSHPDVVGFENASREIFRMEISKCL